MTGLKLHALKTQPPATVYSTSLKSYFLLVDEIPPGMHFRRAYRRKDGTQVAETIARNPRRPRTATTDVPHQPQPPRRRNIKLTLSLAAAGLAIAGTLVGVTVNGSTAGGGSLTVQVRIDITRALAALAKLSLGKLPSASSARSVGIQPKASSSNPTYGTDCAKTATKEVKQFLTSHSCKEYATALLTEHEQTMDAHVAMTWVVMPSTALATTYKSKADRYRYGNPPGEPPAFNGRCYASGQNGSTIWTEQVQPTGRPAVDQAVLHASAPVNLSTEYLREHCRS
jgi:hypothetical protein